MKEGALDGIVGVRDRFEHRAQHRRSRGDGTFSDEGHDERQQLKEHLLMSRRNLEGESTEGSECEATATAGNKG